MIKNKLVQISKIIWPYALVFFAFFAILVSPLSFYSNKNLDIGVVDLQVASSEAEVPIIVGGDTHSFLPRSNPITPLAKNNNKNNTELTADSAFVIDYTSRKVLFSHSEKKVLSLASITKLMSAMVLLDYPIDWSATTTIEEVDGNSDQHVKLGEVFTLEDLWRSALVGSSNKAINALVRSTGANKEEFVSRMNKRAKELKFYSLHFAEPTGLSPKNVGSAEDVANLLRYALRFDKIYTTLQIQEHYATPHGQTKLRRIWNTNWLLTKWIPNDYGADFIVGKTGYINESGYNFVASLTNKGNNRSVIVVALGAQTNEDRYEEVRDLANWAFSQYLWPNDEGYDELVE